MKPVIVSTLLPEKIRQCMWQMLNVRTGATMQQFIETFNICTIYHILNASELLHDIRNSGCTVIVVGNACKVFNLPPDLIHPHHEHGCIWRQIPCVLTSWYNDNDNYNRRLVEMLLEELYVKAGRQLNETH